MKKKKLYLSFGLFLIISAIFLGFYEEETLAASGQKQVIIAKKTKKKVKTETIQSKKALIKSLENHFEKTDTKISYKINKKVVKNVRAFEKIFWNEKNKKNFPSLIQNQMDSFDYTYNDTRQYFYIDISIKFKLSKKELKKFISEMKDLEAAPLIETEEALREAFFSKYLNLENDFRLKISKALAKKYDENTDDFLSSLKDDPRYNDLIWDLDVDGEVESFSSSRIFHFTTNTDKSEEELKRIISKITPILTNKDQVITEIITRAESLDGDYSINIKNDALGYDFKEGKEFWEELNDIPEYNDLSHHNEKGSYSISDYKGYFKLTMFDKFSVGSEDVTGLKSFVKSWVAENIKPEMTEEEKVRAINDFMVKEYRYTYGDRGQLFGKEKGEEKLGKYSVYTCFALIDGKGGVCDAKAKMFYRLSKEAGLEVIYITGSVETGLHAWNLVKVDGVWYHLDNTWNRGQYEGSSEYEYFNTRDYYLKGDDTMRKDHTWDASKFPAAPMDYQGYVPSASTGTPILNKAA